MHTLPLRPSLLRRHAASLCALALVAGCAVQRPPADVAAPTPSAWLYGTTTLPHQGHTADLALWWGQWQDPVLTQLQTQAQAASPTVATAATRVAQARTATVAAGAASTPQLNASAGVGRSVLQAGMPALTQATAGLQVSWELDLWGGLQASSDAANERLQASQAQWHEARVAVAAEVARQYVGLRACQQMLALTAADVQARENIARLTDERLRVGFDAPANAALTRASAAQGRMELTQQEARCKAALAALVALTAADGPALQAQLAPTNPPAPLPKLAEGALPQTLPAQALAQRPDVWAAQRGVAAASADVGAAQADRYPRLGLSGNISRVGSRGPGNDGNTWSIGPLQLTLPLLDGGRRASQVQAQQAAYEEAVVAYRAAVRNAVREVEQALVELHSTATRQADATTATQGFAQALQAATDRHRAGLGNLLELEDARRSALAAQMAQAALERDRLLAWIDLYRAYGGGWLPDATATRPIQAD